MATRRAREQPSSQTPKVQMLKCLCVGCSFNKNAYILTKIAISSSLSHISKYGCACPASEQCTAAAHTSYSHTSNDQAAMSVHERLESYSGNLASARFNGVVQSLTLPQNAQALRQEIGCLLEKGAVELVPPSELESGFYSRYFVVPKRDGGLRPILDLRPINRALCKCPFRMITLKQILAQICPEDWFASVDLKDAYFHIQIAPHHRHFLRFAFEGKVGWMQHFPLSEQVGCASSTICTIG